MIEQSIATQYGVLPSQQEDLKYSDWEKMVSGLMPKTPLGQIVSIRCEKDPNMLKHFTAEQKRIRADWAAYRLRHRVKREGMSGVEELEKMIASMFGG